MVGIRILSILLLASAALSHADSTVSSRISAFLHGLLNRPSSPRRRLLGFLESLPEQRMVNPNNNAQNAGIRADQIPKISSRRPAASAIGGPTGLGMVKVPSALGPPMMKQSHLALIHDTPDAKDPSKILLLHEPDWTPGANVQLTCSGGTQQFHVTSVENYVSLSQPLATVLPAGTAVTSQTGVVTNLTKPTIPGDDHLYVAANHGFLQEGASLTINGQQYVSEHTRTKVLVQPPVTIDCQANEPGLILQLVTNTTMMPVLYTPFMTTVTTTTVLPQIFEIGVVPCTASSGSSQGAEHGSFRSSNSAGSSLSDSSGSSGCTASGSSGSSVLDIWQWLLLALLWLLCCGLFALAALKHTKPSKGSREVNPTPRKKNGHSARAGKSSNASSSAPPGHNHRGAHHGNHSAHHGDHSAHHGDHSDAPSFSDRSDSLMSNDIDGEGKKPKKSKKGSSSKSGRSDSNGHRPSYEGFGVYSGRETGHRPSQDSSRETESFLGSWRQSNRDGDPGFIVPAINMHDVAAQSSRTPHGTNRSLAPGSMRTPHSMRPSLLPPTTVYEAVQVPQQLPPTTVYEAVPAPGTTVYETVPIYETVQQPPATTIYETVVENVPQPAIPSYVVEYVRNPITPAPAPATTTYVYEPTPRAPPMTSYVAAPPVTTTYA